MTTKGTPAHHLKKERQIHALHKKRAFLLPACPRSTGLTLFVSVPHPSTKTQLYHIDQDLQNRWFDFGGDALINTNRHVRLTQDMPSQSGWLWSRLVSA
jgi:hypothetical protein